MALANQINTEKICRTCLSEESNMKSLFSVDKSKGETLALYDMLMACASVQIIEEDGLPEQVCVQCTQNIIRSYSFKQLCEKSDSTLRQMLVQPKKEQEEEQEEPQDHKTESYMKVKPYQCGSPKMEISNQIHYEYLEPKVESMDIVMQKTDPLDSEVSADGVKSEISKEESELKIHEDDPKQITYPCKKCALCFSTHTDLKVHLQTHLKEITKHVCKVCHRDFSYYSNLHRHMKVHGGVKRHLCTECGKSFSRSDDFKKHLRVHTGERPYPCKICGKSYADSFKLLEHTRAHANKKNFVCSICSKGFSRRAGLRGHKKIHSGIKTHECTICDKRLCGPGSLAIHMKIHTGLKDHICPFCGKGFTTRCNMKSHERTHTGEKPYVCNVCGKRFPNLSGLTLHNKSHNNESSQPKKHLKSCTSKRPITSENGS